MKAKCMNKLCNESQSINTLTDSQFTTSYYYILQLLRIIERAL